MTRAAGPTKTKLDNGQTIEDWTDHSVAPASPSDDDVLGGRNSDVSNAIADQVNVGKTRDIPPGGTK
jgi:hypothetical protein